MKFGKKKELVKDIDVDVLGEGSPVEPQAPTPPPMQITKEEEAKMVEIKEHLKYFEENYGRVDFGNDLNGLKNLLFGILIELRKINKSLEEE